MVRGSLQVILMASGLNRKAFSIFDGVLISSLLIISISGFVFMDRFLSDSDSVRVEVEGRLHGVYPISENRLLTVHGPLGDTVIEIKNRSVRVVSSACPNKLCVHQGFIKRGSIICLPNRVVITIGVSSVDAITG